MAMRKEIMAKKSEKVRHILPLSGGKDSAALAVYFSIYRRDSFQELEYVFLDTGHELPETYEFLNRMRAVLNIDINYIRSDRSFEDWLKFKNFYLPSPLKRWCTEELKIKPFERYIGNDKAYSYLGIRADEDRDGYISNKTNIIPYYPFVEDGLVLSDIISLLESSGLGLPGYYTWRSRSGCYFCFFQQKIEWLNLYELHRDLFLEAMSFEKIDQENGTRFTWCQDESLAELLERSAKIRENHNNDVAPIRKSGKKRIQKLIDILPERFPSCVICE